MTSGQTFDAIILSTPVFQYPDGTRPSVRAVLPSKTPSGDAQLILTYHGRESNPFNIRVVNRDFGLYALVQTSTKQDEFSKTRSSTQRSPASL
jgi:hypothetical protein